QCQSPASTETENPIVYMAKGYEFPYNLREPDQTMELAPVLNEISGLSMAYRDTRIAAINDELGTIYLLDPQNGKILQEIPFWKTGDYEGIEVKGSDAYVVKSSGTIYEVKHFGTEGQEVTKYNTVLGKENDVEGFCFNMEGDKLLMACKGQAGIKGQNVEVKNIYSFDLETKTVDTIPYLEIVRSQVNEFLQQNTSIPKLEKLVEFFDPSHPSFTLAPSAIAVHPTTGHLFITSSVGKVFMVLDTSGNILYIEKLSKKIHPQPEGMCFATDGTLYISSEGKELGAGRIQKFVLKR
ncbi:MAG: SdiA-regulated domain-containing protein, partial [Bacteroidota bacterium]